jgi:hypothetical protein
MLQFLRLDNLKSLGAKSIGQRTPSQGEAQNFVFSLLPIVTKVAAVSNFWSSLLQGLPRPVQYFVSLVHSSHSHLNLRAATNFSRCKMPRPPSLVGWQTFFLTRENCEATAPQHFIKNKGSSICTKNEQRNKRN